MRRIIITAAVVLALGITVVYAVKPYPIEEVSRDEIIVPIVEQQTPGGATQPDPDLWVINRTGCLWDADDHLNVQSAGRLTTAYTQTECVIADGTNHLVALVVTVKNKPTPDVLASIHFTRNDTPWNLDVQSSVLAPRDRHFSEIRLCTFTPEYDNDDPTYDLIPDSNGGIGWPTDVEFTVEGSAKALSMRVAIVGDSSTNVARWCPHLN